MTQRKYIPIASATASMLSKVIAASTPEVYLFDLGFVRQSPLVITLRDEVILGRFWTKTC